MDRTLDVIEKESTVPTFDFMWTDPADDARDRRFTRMALVTEGNEVPLRQVYPNDQVYVADASLKVRFSKIYFVDKSLTIFARWSWALQRRRTMLRLQQLF